MQPERRAHELIEHVYDGVLTPARWGDFVRELSEACDGAAVMFSIDVPGDPLGLQRYSVGLLDEFLDTQAELVVRGLPWSSSFVSRFAGRFAELGEVFPGVELRQSEFYKEWMKPQKLAPVWPVGCTVQLADGVPAAGLTLFRPARRGAFEPRHLALGELLLPHLTRAVGFYTALGAMQRERLALAEVMDRLPTGVILLDAQRQPVVTNRSADGIVALRDGFSLDPNGPCLASARENATLQKLLADLLEVKPGQELQSSGFMSISRPSGRRPS